MFTISVLGSAAVLAMLPIILLLLLIYTLYTIGSCICIYLKDRMERKKAQQHLMERKAEIDSVLKEEHDFWLKLNEPEGPLTKDEILHYLNECERLREEAFMLAHKESPYLFDYKLPHLTKNRFKLEEVPLGDDKVQRYNIV